MRRRASLRTQCLHGRNATGLPTLIVLKMGRYRSKVPVGEDELIKGLDGVQHVKSSGRDVVLVHPVSCRC